MIAAADGHGRKVRRRYRRLERLLEEIDIDGGRNLGDGWWIRVEDRATGKVVLRSVVSPEWEAARMEPVPGTGGIEELMSSFLTARGNGGRLDRMDTRREAAKAALRDIGREADLEELDDVIWWLDVRSTQRRSDEA